MGASHKNIIKKYMRMGVSLSIICYSLAASKSLIPRGDSRDYRIKFLIRYTFECQYAKPINTAWNGSLPQANIGDIFIAAPLV